MNYFISKKNSQNFTSPTCLPPVINKLNKRLLKFSLNKQQVHRTNLSFSVAELLAVATNKQQAHSSGI